VLLAVYVEELFAGVDICDCDCDCEGGVVSSVGDARVLDDDGRGGGDDDEGADDAKSAARLVSWKGAIGAALPPFVIVREEPDDDAAAALEGDTAGRVDEDDGPDAFDFPLSVEWWK